MRVLSLEHLLIRTFHSWCLVQMLTHILWIHYCLCATTTLMIVIDVTLGVLHVWRMLAFHKVDGWGTLPINFLSILHKLSKLLAHYVFISSMDSRIFKQIELWRWTFLLSSLVPYALSMRRFLIFLQQSKVFLIAFYNFLDWDSINFDSTLHDIVHHFAIFARTVLVHQQNLIRLGLIL